MLDAPVSGGALPLPMHSTRVRAAAFTRRADGSRNSYVATLVERHSRYVMLVKVANKDTESVVSALIKQSQRLPSELYRSLTGTEAKSSPIISA